MRLGGEDSISDCSFLANSASRGLAVAVVGSAEISGLEFNGNELYCEAGSYRAHTEVRLNDGYVPTHPTEKHPARQFQYSQAFRLVVCSRVLRVFLNTSLGT